MAGLGGLELRGVGFRAFGLGLATLRIHEGL